MGFCCLSFPSHLRIPDLFPRTTHQARFHWKEVGIGVRDASVLSPAPSWLGFSEGLQVIRRTPCPGHRPVVSGLLPWGYPPAPYDCLKSSGATPGKAIRCHGSLQSHPRHGLPCATTFSSSACARVRTAGSTIPLASPLEMMELPELRLRRLHVSPSLAKEPWLRFW